MGEREKKQGEIGENKKTRAKGEKLGKMGENWGKQLQAGENMENKEKQGKTGENS